MGSYSRWERATAEVKHLSSSNQRSLIFLDTNFLMALCQMPNFNLSYELDRVIPRNRILVVLEPIFSELKKLHLKGKPKERMESRVAIEFVHKYCQQWPSEYNHRNIDFILLHYGKERNGIIATNDRKLKRMARKKGIKLLYIRNQRFLELQ
ncbi:MAG: type II toxin-antitoxin system VapC family toxin [Candidatus Hodarchaeales archaeon]|jgi:rRNA-processing protein FCF1